MATPTLDAGATQGAGVGAQGAQADPPQSDGQTGADGTPTATPPAEPPPLSNADLKAHPWVQGMSDELTELRAKETAREQAEQKAADEKAKEEGRLQDIIDTRDTDLKAANERALTAEIKAELAMKGGKVTDALVKVAVAGYDPAKYAAVEDYAEAFSTDEAYAPFFAAEGTQRIVPDTTPGRPAVAGATGSITIEQCKSLEASDKPEDKKQARDFLDAYYKEHNKFPY